MALQRSLVKGQGGGAVRQGLLQLCTNPAEQGHEVIADGMHPMASQPLQVFHELSDVPLPLRAAMSSSGHSAPAGM